MTTTFWIVLLVLLLLAVLPAWPYSRGWGYFPSGLLGIFVFILLFMLLFGYL
jgi:hypothetical protein